MTDPTPTIQRIYEAAVAFRQRGVEPVAVYLGRTEWNDLRHEETPHLDLHPAPSGDGWSFLGLEVFVVDADRHLRVIADDIVRPHYPIPPPSTLVGG